MKKFFIFALLAAVLMAAPMVASATCNYGCDYKPMPLAGSAEAQAFQHMDLAYGQDAGVQNVSQFTTTFKNTQDYTVKGDVYGSIHMSPDTLFFVGLNGSYTKTDTVSVSVSKVCADINAMNGSVVMGADAGASAASTGFAGASSMAGNSGGLTQTQTLAFNHGGTGFQSMTVNGYTGVSANAGK